MGKATVEEQLAALRDLKASAEAVVDNADASDRLRPFLLQQNNLVVARAADLARAFDSRTLLPELVSAFRRFLEKPAKDDPQCWAKNALSKALHQLGCEDSSLFLQGMRTHQFEPVWGGQSDVAGTLRANCAHALIDCHELTHQALLLHLLEIVADSDKAVRAEAMRAIAQAGGDSAVLLLRMRALTSSDEEPEVIGHCYTGLLALERDAAVPFVAQFLSRQDERSAEAAVALGETRTPAALVALLACLHQPADSNTSRARRAAQGHEPAFAAALLTGIALTRQAKAIDTLLDLVATESSHAEAAIEALATAHFGTEVQGRLAAVVGKLDSGHITRSCRQHFPQ